MAYQQVVEPHHKLKFTGNVTLVHQQMENPLRGAVTVTTAEGEAQDIADLIDADDYQRGEDYSRRNPEFVPKNSRRWLVRPEVIETGQYITKEETFDKAMDASSILLRNKVKAVERGVFDTILGVEKVKATGKFRIAGGGIMGGVYEG
ncbi:MAG: phage capsid protein, partial [Rhodobacterales bacterium]